MANLWKFQSRCRSILPLVLTLALVTTPGESRNRKTDIYKNYVLLGGIELVMIDTACLTLTSSMSAGEFFKGLRRIDKRKGPEYRKGRRPIKHFPDKLLVELVGRTTRCPRTLRVPLVKIAVASVKELMDFLHFEVEWATDLRSRPADITEIGKAQKHHTKVGTHWSRTLAIRTTNVPLTDRLRVILVSEDHVEIARFTGQVAP